MAASSSVRRPLPGKAFSERPSRPAGSPTLPAAKLAAVYYDEDISPSTSCCPRSSSDTISSTASDEEDDCWDDDGLPPADQHEPVEVIDEPAIPPLPAYHRDELFDPTVRACTPHEFGKLFPSMDRFSIRHDDFTSDGNMNLRVETSRPKRIGGATSTMQLFHLRMYDLARRDFSLRRYCRDSGREVCNSKRKYVEKSSPADGARRGARPAAIASALKSTFRRSASPASLSPSSDARFKEQRHDPPAGDLGISRIPSFESSASASSQGTTASQRAARPRKHMVPTDTIKLEFSNYARVDLRHASFGRYDFEWWGHRYSWCREVHAGRLRSVSWHLLRHGAADATGESAEAIVAHIVPEMRSPSQVFADEEAGGWVPPCHMWINDASVIECMTDVADVIMATGLIALVDDCIAMRWPSQQSLVMRSTAAKALSLPESVGPRALVQHLFRRQQRPQRLFQHAHQSPGRHRFADPVFAY